MKNDTYANGDKLLRVLVVTLIFSVMNGTMFNVALPAIGKEFELLPSQVSWIMTSYMALYAIGSVVFGKLADSYSLKSLITCGLLLFAVGSVVGMLAVDFWMIILGRVLQAAGAAVLPAIAMIIPIRYFEPEKRGRALGTSAIGLALGGALGPIVSGMIMSFGSWRILFLFSLLPLLTIPFFRRYLNDERGAAKPLDVIGGGFLAAAVGLFLLAITQSSWAAAVIGGLFLLMFAIRIRKTVHPFIQPELFMNARYTGALVIAFISTSMNFSITFITPQYLTVLNNLSAGSIGFVLVPAAIAAATLGRVGGKLADERGNSTLFSIAAALLVLCFILTSTFVGISPYVIALLLIMGQVGQTFMQIAMSNTISRTLSKEQVGVGMGLFSMLNFISGAMAMGIIGKVLDQSATWRLNPLAGNESAYVYSNIFFIMTALSILVWGLYQMQFGPKTDRRPFRNT